MREGWEIKKLQEIAEYSIGLTYTPNEVSNDGIVVLRSSNIQDGKIDLNDIVRVDKKVNERLLVKKGDILMCSRNGSKKLVGKTATIPELHENMTFGTFMTIIRSPYNQFLSWFFISEDFRDQISRGENTVINQVTKYMLDEIQISLPPIAEQQKINSILNSAFKAIDKAKANAEKNLKNSREIFESYLEGVFERKGEDWEECHLERYIKLIDYRGRTPVKTNSGVRLITAKNVKLGYLQLEPQEFIGENNYKSWMSRGIPNFGDVIFTTEAPLANVAQIDSTEKLAFAQRIIVMQPDKTKINSTFLKYMLLSPPVRKRILLQGTGATVVGIKSSLLKKIIVYFPKKTSEQELIIERLDALKEQTQRLEKAYLSKIDYLEELKKSILQKAFAGELTISESLLENVN